MEYASSSISRALYVKIDGLTKGAFDAKEPVYDTQGIIDEGQVALLYGTCVGEVDGLTKGAFDAQELSACTELAYDVHDAYDAVIKSKVVLLHGTCWRGRWVYRGCL